MEYRCISADCHIDLCWLPHDLFVANASQQMKERMPYVTHGPDGARWTTKAGANLGFANSKGYPGTTANGNETYMAGRHFRHDRIFTSGLYSDGTLGIFRPTTPELRLKDQDRDGIQAEVMYGLHSAGVRMTDQEASIELYRIYNDWLAEFCNYDRKRFVGLASMPSHTVEKAVSEAHRVASLGLGGLDFLASWDMIPLWSPYWDPFWQAAVEVNLPVHFHTLASPPAAPIPEGLPARFALVSRASLDGARPIHLAAILGALIFGGALERYPSLRIVLGESGIGWIPFVLERMDRQFEGPYQTLGLKMKPSEYWRRQCRATFQSDRVGTKNLDDMGIENVMWASDYPHPDGVFPDSQEYIKRQFSDLPAATTRKVICENAGKFYGLIPA